MRSLAVNKPPARRMPEDLMAETRRIGFVSTRLAGTDGVSLETSKWVTVLERLGHTCFYFAGQSDWPADSRHGLKLSEIFINHDGPDRHCEEPGDAAIQEVMGHRSPRPAASR